jgi:hypothetical protein
MKKIFIFSLLFLVIAAGCGKFYHQKPDGTILSYERYGDIDMSGLHIEDTNGIYIGIETFKSDAQILTDALTEVTKLAGQILELYAPKPPVK